MPAVHRRLLRRRGAFHLLAEGRNVKLRPRVVQGRVGLRVDNRRTFTGRGGAQRGRFGPQLLVQNDPRRDDGKGDFVGIAIGKIGLDVLCALHGQAPTLGDGDAVGLEDGAVGKRAKRVVVHALDVPDPEYVVDIGRRDLRLREARVDLPPVRSERVKRRRVEKFRGSERRVCFEVGLERRSVGQERVRDSLDSISGLFK